MKRQKIIKCKKCKKRTMGDEEICSFCGEPLSGRGKDSLKWHQKTSITLSIAGVTAIVALGFIHIITGVISPFRLPFDIALKKEFGYKETFVSFEKITSLPYVVAKAKYPLGCEVLQRLRYIESSEVFDTMMVIDLREAISVWKTEFGQQLEKPVENWRDKLFEQDGQVEADSAWSYNNRAITSARSGDYETAISHFNRALRKDPALAECYYNRAIVYVSFGQLGSAVNDLSKAIETKPDFIYAYLGRAELNAALGNYEEAIADYTKILETDSDQYDVCFQRAMVYFIEGQYDKAWDDVRKLQGRGLIIPEMFIYYLQQASETQG